MNRQLLCLKWMEVEVPVSGLFVIAPSSLLLHFPEHPQIKWSVNHLLGLTGLLWVWLVSCSSKESVFGCIITFSPSFKKKKTGFIFLEKFKLYRKTEQKWQSFYISPLSLLPVSLSLTSCIGVCTFVIFGNLILIHYYLLKSLFYFRIYSCIYKRAKFTTPKCQFGMQITLSPKQSKHLARHFWLYP